MDIKLTFEKLAYFNRNMEPCSLAIPFSQGELTHTENIQITDGISFLPIQAKATAFWPDKTVKWAYIDFLADLPGNESKEFKLTVKHKQIEDSHSNEKIETIIEKDGILIKSNDFSAHVSAPENKKIFNYIKSSTFNFDKTDFFFPSITDEKNITYTGRLTEEWKIIASGPVKVQLRGKGKHYSDLEESCLDFELDLTLYAGKPWIKIDYRIINREEQEYLLLNDINFSIHFSHNSTNVQTAIATSNYESNIVNSTQGESIEQIIDEEYLIYDMNEHFPETFYGTFWADWSNESEGGICLTQFQAYQNFPKSLHVSKGVLKVGILPKGKLLELPQGVAKTHTLFLHFHSNETDVKEINNRSLQFQLPDRPVIDPNNYFNSGVFDNIYSKKRIKNVEKWLLDLADKRPRAYGILAWGDAPDEGYTAQGRGHGQLVWSNNEYDFPHGAMVLYAKTGERRFLDYQVVSARHQMDVDICHYSKDPLRFQGQIIHSAKHTTGEVKPCHQWVEGILDYYHSTGEQRALDAAIGMGENLLRLLEQPRYQGEGGINARETGWALRSLTALYKETYNEKWLIPADKIIGHYEQWKSAWGGWLSPYTDHTTIRVPFMISVAVNSLMRYYRIRESEKIKTMIIDAVIDLVDNCLMENGLFYYKELPSLRRNGNNPLVLEALSYTYEFTKNKKFLEAGIKTFEMALQRACMSFGGMEKRYVENSLILGGGMGPKVFAQYIYPILYFYKTAVEAGVLKADL